MEGAFVGGLVAHEEGEAFFVDVPSSSKHLGLKSSARLRSQWCWAMRSTSMVSVRGHGAVFAFEIDEQPVVFFGVLPRQEEEVGVHVGEAVAGVVAGRGGFAFFRFGTGGKFGVGLVGCDLRFGRHDFGMLLRTRVSIRAFGESRWGRAKLLIATGCDFLKRRRLVRQIQIGRYHFLETNGLGARLRAIIGLALWLDLMANGDERR